MSWWGKKEGASSGGGSSSYGDNNSFPAPDSIRQGSSDLSHSYADDSSTGQGGSFQEQLALEQQKVMIQNMMLKLTDTAFQKCVTKPTSSLTSSEQICIQTVVTKYIESSEFVLEKLSRNQ